MGRNRRALTGCLVIGVALSVTACTSTGNSLSSWGNSNAALELPASVDFYPDAEVLKVAKSNFVQGNYGLAARYYERAVEVDPNNGEAWLGLAAAYDRIRRFDLADRAYTEAGKILGNRAEFFNNVGYSYLLRGDLAKARTSFVKAYELAPNNLAVINNIELMRASMRGDVPR